MNLTRSNVFFILAFAFFFIATLISGGVISGGPSWLVDAGLTSMVLGFIA